MPEDLSGTFAGLERARRLVLSWIAPAEAIQAFVDDLRQLAPDVAEHARSAAQHHDGLLRDKRRQVVAVLQGGACLLSDLPKLLQALNEQMTVAEAAIGTAAETAESVSRTRAEIKASLVMAAKLMISGRKFCDPDNLRGLAKWASLDAMPGQRHRLRETETGLDYVVETGRDATGGLVWWGIAVPSRQSLAVLDETLPAPARFAAAR